MCDVCFCAGGVLHTFILQVLTWHLEASITFLPTILFVSSVASADEFSQCSMKLYHLFTLSLTSFPALAPVFLCSLTDLTSFHFFYSNFSFEKETAKVSILLSSRANFKFQCVKFSLPDICNFQIAKGPPLSCVGYRYTSAVNAG